MQCIRSRTRRQRSNKFKSIGFFKFLVDDRWKSWYEPGEKKRKKLVLCSHTHGLTHHWNVHDFETQEYMDITIITSVLLLLALPGNHELYFQTICHWTRYHTPHQHGSLPRLDIVYKQHQWPTGCWCRLWTISKFRREPCSKLVAQGNYPIPCLGELDVSQRPDGSVHWNLIGKLPGENLCIR